MIRYQDVFPIPSWRDVHDERARDDDEQHLRDRALERAERELEHRGLDGMSLPTAEISVERIRPAAGSDDPDPYAAARGVLFGMFIGALFWVPVLLWGLPAARGWLA